MPRMPVITAYKEAFRCEQCGNDLSTLMDVQKESLCPKCQSPYPLLPELLFIRPFGTFRVRRVDLEKGDQKELRQ